MHHKQEGQRVQLVSFIQLETLDWFVCSRIRNIA